MQSLLASRQKLAAPAESWLPSRHGGTEHHRHPCSRFSTWLGSYGKLFSEPRVRRSFPGALSAAARPAANSRASWALQTPPGPLLRLGGGVADRFSPLRRPEHKRIRQTKCHGPGALMLSNAPTATILALQQPPSKSPRSSSSHPALFSRANFTAEDS